MDVMKSRPANSRVVRFGCLFVLAAVTFGLISYAYSDTQSAQYKEYEIKAAFIYNFLKFVDWPEKKMAVSDDKIIIGIIGEDPFGAAANVFKDKLVEKRSLVVKRFESLTQLKEMDEKGKLDLDKKIEELRTCHLLFICPSEQKQLREIIKLVDKHNVLTVGDSTDFLEAGGIINFFIHENKIRFNINLTATEKAGLKIRSQLLRLAKEVIKEEPDEKDPVDKTAQQEDK